MSDQIKAIARRTDTTIARHLPPPDDLSHSVSSDTALMTRQLWAALRRRWRFGLGVFVVIASAVVAGTLLRPANYRATGLLEIRPENADAVPVATLFGPQRLAGESLATQFGVLKSVTLAERVVAEGHLDRIDRSWLSSVPPLRWLRGGTEDVEKKVGRLQEHLIVSPQEGSRLVNISFDDSDPQRAADVVNSVLANYLRLRVEESQRSAEWLGRQSQEARDKLDASQRRLRAYVRQHGLQVLETGQGETENLVNDRLKQLHEQLTNAQADRYAQQSAYELVSQQAVRGRRGIASPILEGLSLRLADLQREAAGLSATFHEDYPRLQEVRRQILAVERAIGEEAQFAVNRAQRDYQAAQMRESLLEGALKQQQDTAQALEGSSAGYAPMKREVATDQQLYEALNQKLKEVNISAALKATNAGIVDPAKPPREPYQSPLALNLAVGLVLALMGGIGGALGRDYCDNRVRRVEDVDGFMGVPAVGVIPHISLKKVPKGPQWMLTRGGEPIVWRGAVARRGDRRWYEIDSGDRNKPVLADAFAALRAAVIFHQNSPQSRSLLITSPGVGEGKTTVSVNLALSLARLGQRVLLIDGDLRHPSVHEAFGLGVDRGLTRYLEGKCDWQAAVHVDVFPSLAVMPAGALASHPADLLATPRMRELVIAASKVYDYVLIDSPPMLTNLPDARILSNLADGVLLTVRGGSTPRDVALRTVSQLRRVVGIVVNDFDMSETTPYYRDGWDADIGTVA